jgi:transglutaminase-like putative cysteine protease
MKLSIRHTTRYSFSRPVQHGLQRLRLYPKTTNGQNVAEWHMDLAGVRQQVTYDDQHHNHTTLVTVLPDAREVVIACHGMVETSDNGGVIGHHAGHLPLWHFVGQTPRTRMGPRMRELLGSAEVDRSNIIGTLHRLSALIIEAVPYATGGTDASTTAEEAAQTGAGVCQDHAHLFIGLARQIGVPARYVSGYLMLDDRVHQDAGHAWAEAHVDGLGWTGFDISNGICPDPRYVRIATGRDYAEAAPVTGLNFGEGECSLDVSLAVEQQSQHQQQSGAGFGGEEA